MGFLKGWLYCYLWYSSILAGYAGLFCPLLPILFISNKLYRYCTDFIFTFWQSYPTALLRYLCNCKIELTGDYINCNEVAILIMNHRTRTDWNFIWPTLFYAVKGYNNYFYPTKFILKDVIRHLPGPGWVMQLACFLYIKRQWSNDKKIIKDCLDYYKSLSPYKYSLLIFPEGTDLTDHTKALSDRYAEKNNLIKFNYVLHPRTRGFTYLINESINNLDVIYDLTILYPDLIPQNEKYLLNGKFPKLIKIHLKRITIEQLNYQINNINEINLDKFLQFSWIEKEKNLKNFYKTGEYFQNSPIIITNNNEKIILLIISLIFWTILPFIVLYIFITNSFFYYIIIVHTIFIIFLNCFYGGFQNFEINLNNCKKKYLFF